MSNGVLLRESGQVRYTPEYRAHGNFYGTREMVGLLERAARHVARRFPLSVLSVGEISKASGGTIGGHASHQSGRDVDIAFYMKSGRGTPYLPAAFAGFDAQGHGMTPNQGLRFDEDRNWELVSRLITDAEARVQHIFVSAPLRALLLRTAARRHAPASVVRRAQLLMQQPSHGHPHHNHFHVRIYCAPGDRPRCMDNVPFHPWYPGTPPTAREMSRVRDAMSARSHHHDDD